jgi:hypothetical protein
MPVPDYGDIPTWTAVGVAACALIGAGLAYRRQSEQVQLQRQQLDDQRKVNEKQTTVLELHSVDLRESLNERLRAQAAQVFIEVDRIPSAAGTTAKAGQKEPGPVPWRLTAKVHNMSKQPIHDLYVIWQHGTVRLGKPDPMARLMPGQDASFDRTVPPASAPSPPVDPGMLGAFLAFRDAAGVRWAIREDGTLTEISRPSQDTQPAQK